MEENTIKIKFYDQDVEVQKTFSHDKIRDKKNYIYMAEFDYLAFRMFYKLPWRLLHPIALSHAQQSIEKYCCFMQSFLFNEKLQKWHKVAQFNFLKSVPPKSKKVIDTLFTDFQKYRYLEEWYSYTMEQIVDVLDEFVLNVWSLLLYSGIMWHMRFIDKLDMVLNKGLPSQIIPNLFLYRKDRAKEPLLETYLSVVEFENKSLNKFNEVFDFYETHCMKPN